MDTPNLLSKFVVNKYLSYSFIFYIFLEKSYDAWNHEYKIPKSMLIFVTARLYGIQCIQIQS